MLYATYFYRSILSQYNGTSTEGGSFRCNNNPQQWTAAAYYPSTTTECTSNTPHHHLPTHAHQHNYPPQYNQHHFQHQQPHNIIANGALPPHGRLQKSLSFAFTTPASTTMMNEVYHPSCPNQSNAINYPERSHSRYVISMGMLQCVTISSLTDVIYTIAIAIKIMLHLCHMQMEDFIQIHGVEVFRKA